VFSSFWSGTPFPRLHFFLKQLRSCPPVLPSSSFDSFHLHFPPSGGIPCHSVIGFPDFSCIRLARLSFANHPRSTQAYARVFPVNTSPPQPLLPPTSLDPQSFRYLLAPFFFFSPHTQLPFLTCPNPSRGPPSPPPFRTQHPVPAVFAKFVR